ncbi:NAD(P)-binding protein [Setomelanomma holmii]|uniref:NAD(P)-binding protein n=1 Tax=Setomelanomma holmii TaxID=210430 RepID=A0A9P4H0G3_9PLEO|nr:NAD(P)-binding protein [Setomelanomma holmii]
MSHVHALVTDASSERALARQSLGPHITLYPGTWKDPSTIKIAASGCRALLLNQLPSFLDDAEVQEARVVLEIAKEVGVQHVIFTLTVPLNNPNVREDLKDSAAAPAVLNKGDVEELVKASEMMWTLLRPGWFMTNLLPPLVYWMFPEVKEGRFVNSYGPDCLMDLIDPDDFHGQTITLVAGNVRLDDMVKELAETSGQSLTAIYRTKEETEQAKSNPFVAGQLLSIGMDELVDLEEATRWGVPLTSFKQFLETHRDEFAGVKGSQGADTFTMTYADSLISGKE